MLSPEDVQQFFIRDDGRVILYLDSFSMVGNVIVAGVSGGATGIAHPGANNAIESSKTGVWSPESAQGKGGGFDFGGSAGIYWWNIGS